MGNGGKYRQAVDSITNAVGLALGGKPMEGVLAGAASPYINEQIKRATENIPELNVPAHMVWGAIEAELQGGSATSGAIAAGVGEASAKYLTQSLYNTDNPEELTEAQKNTVADLSKIASGVAAGVSGTATGGDSFTVTSQASAGMGIAENAVENNYLSDEQQALYAKELSECQDLKCKVITKTYWNAVDLGQDASFATGIIAGVPESAYDMASAVLNMAMNPIETLEAMRTMITQDEAFSKIAGSVKQSYIEQINKLETEYQKAGSKGSFNAGREVGKLLVDFASVATGLGGVVKGGTKVGAEAITRGIASAKKASQVVGDQVNKSVNKNNLKTMVLSQETAIASQSGHISKTQIEKYGEILKPTTNQERELIQQIVKGDPTGALTEDLINSVATRSGFKPVSGGKYGKNDRHGFDHMLVYEKEGVPLIIDSKQISTQGTIKISTKAAGNTYQLSKEWIDVVMNRIDVNSEAYKILRNARHNNIPIKTMIAGVDKSTGEIKLIPVTVRDKK